LREPVRQRETNAQLVGSPRDKYLSDSLNVVYYNWETGFLVGRAAIQKTA